MLHLEKELAQFHIVLVKCTSCLLAAPCVICYKWQTKMLLKQCAYHSWFTSQTLFYCFIFGIFSYFCDGIQLVFGKSVFVIGHLQIFCLHLEIMMIKYLLGPIAPTTLTHFMWYSAPESECEILGFVFRLLQASTRL